MCLDYFYKLFLEINVTVVQPKGGFLHLISFSKLNNVSLFSYNVHIVKKKNSNFVLLLALLTKM